MDPAVDGDADPRVEVFHGRKDSLADCLAFDDAEPGLSRFIHEACADRGSRVLGQLPLDAGVPVGGVSVRNQAQLVRRSSAS